jgi:3-deoxy-D-manno-octulosonic-acid transferase
MSVAWMAYRMIAPMLGAAAPAARIFASPSERPLWSERLGRVRGEAAADAWIHAASLGEALAVGPLTRELEKLAPSARFHVTATTRGGRGRLGELGYPYSLAPLDAPQSVARFLEGVAPRRVILVETELWPHWLLAARARGVPVAVVSARLSARSVQRYARLGSAFRALVGGLAAVLCQTEEDRSRWLSVGALDCRTIVAGNLKTDALAGPPADRARERADLGLDRDRPLLVLGNVRPGEIEPIARAWKALEEGVRRRWQVVAVPRHARASAELRAEASRAGQPIVLSGPPAEGAWGWDDRLGILGRYYAAADVAVVCGTIGPYGGHNPLEPAARGAAVLVGPNHWAQADGVRALAATGGARVAADSAALEENLKSMLSDEPARAALVRAALETVRAQSGSARRTAEALAVAGFWPVP